MNFIDEDPSRAEETRMLLQAAIESANDAILITELNLEHPGPRIEYVNPAFTRMTQYTESDAVGSTPRILQGPKTDRGLLDRLRTDLRTGQSFHGQTVNYRKDRSEYVVEWRITPVKDRDGAPIKWLAVQRDVTDRVRAEQALRASETQLRAANQDLEQFVFSASHDLQEPIRNVAIHSQIISERYGSTLPALALTHFDFVMEGAQRVGSLVQDLLAYTRASTAGYEQPAELLDTNRVLAGVLNDLSRPISERGAVVRTSTLPQIRMRAVHLRQILQNLIANAIKYSKKNGRPEITVQAVESARAMGPCIAVGDNGIGIDPAYFTEIFGVFRLLHGRNYPGTGIGLAITQRIIERYGGRVWIESEPGKGSTFFFTTSQQPEEKPNG